jgi:hypothetical protein
MSEPDQAPAPATKINRSLGVNDIKHASLATSRNVITFDALVAAEHPKHEMLLRQHE